MTTHPFDTIIDRSNTGSEKWQRYPPEVLPMWVADMDFATPEPVVQALQQRVAHGVFGYTSPSPALRQAVVAHVERVHNWCIDPSWLVFVPGIVTGFNTFCRMAIGAKTSIVCQVPVYPPFLSAPKRAGGKLQTVAHADGISGWRGAIHDDTAALMLCHPHNPHGSVCTPQQLQELADLIIENNLLVCSDEIWSDLILDENAGFRPFASIDERLAQHCVTLIAPSKTFNIAGLGCSVAIIADPTLRKRYWQAQLDQVPWVNTLALTAAEAAYRHGEPWRQQLVAYLRRNRAMVQQCVASLPRLHYQPGAASFLAWIDARQWDVPNPALWCEQHGLGLSDGAPFGAPGWLRLNFGCPRALLKEGLQRLAAADAACS